MLFTPTYAKIAPNQEQTSMYEINSLSKKISELNFKLLYTPEVTSTMQVIDEQTRANNKKRLIALTDHQTKGIGRIGRLWLDTPQSSLMFSILMQIPQSTIATFADLVALEVAKALQKTTNAPIQIKYPNDIVISDKKLGGILVKNIYNDKLEYLGTNIGIGLNVHYTNDMLKDFPTDYPATSLDIYTGTHTNRQDLFLQILNSLQYLDTEIKTIQINPRAKEQFDIQWRKISNMLGKKINILKQNTIVATGLVTDMSLGKGIQLNTTNGKQWYSLFATDMKARITN